MENKANCPPIQPGPMAQTYELQGFFGKYNRKPYIPEPNYHIMPGVLGTKLEYVQMLEKDIKQANIEIGGLNFKLNEALEINANLVKVKSGVDTNSSSKPRNNSDDEREIICSRWSFEPFEHFLILIGFASGIGVGFFIGSIYGRY